MATPTSSSNRSKRKGTKPVTQGQNPQRANRQKVSNAQVTNSSTRGSNAGSAKVTTGAGGAKPAAKALPPGRQGVPLATQSASTRRSGTSPSTGGALATQGRGPLGGQRSLPPGRKGGAMERSGPTIDVKANADKLPRGAKPPATGRPALPPGRSAPGGRMGLTGPLIGMQLGKALADTIGGAYGQAIRKERGQRAAETGQYGRYSPGGQQSRGGMGGVSNIPPGEGPRNNTNYGKPPARPSASRPSQSTPSRSTASSGGSGTAQGSSATKPAMPGRKWEDFNPGRGTSKSNNPLLDRDSGGMKLRDRMKQREASAQGEKAKSLSNNFGQDSGYQPKTKVDGSQYADKKPDMKKVNEYDRRKRRYYD